MNMPNELVISLEADHIEMTKFVNKSDRIFQQILEISSSSSTTLMHFRKLNI